MCGWFDQRYTREASSPANTRHVLMTPASRSNAVSVFLAEHYRALQRARKIATSFRVKRKRKSLSTWSHYLPYCRSRPPEYTQPTTTRTTRQMLRGSTRIVSQNVLVRHTLDRRCKPLTQHVFARLESTYENYDTTSKQYDNARNALAAGHVVQSTLERVASALDTGVGELQVLEAGCGTGNYSIHMAKMGVARVHAIDGNQGMLDQLQAKINLESGLPSVLSVREPVDLASPDMQLPFDDNSLHFAMVSQVTHHLVREELDDPHARVSALVDEIGRVVMPGGAILIQTSTPNQQRHGFWWADIVPAAATRLAQRLSDVRSCLMASKAAFDQP